MNAQLKRLIEEHAELLRVARLIDRANAKRANALVQDQITRLDYEETLGHALDELRRLLTRMEQGKPVGGN